MKRLILAVIVLGSAGLSEASVLLGLYEFTGNRDVTTQPSGATFSTFNKNFLVDGGTGGGVWALSGWDTSPTAPHPNRNMQFQITPDAGSGSFLILDRISFTVNIDDIDSPLFGRVSLFQQGSVIPVATSDFLFNETPTPITFDFPDFSSSDPVTVRFYGWGAGSSSGQTLYDNVGLYGVVAVPEPTRAALIVFGFCLAGVGVFRRVQTRWITGS